MKLNEAIDKALKESKKRKFKQSIDLAISLKHVDLKKSGNKFSEEVILPHGRGKSPKIGVFGGPGLIEKAKKFEGVTAISEADISSLAKNKRNAKKFARQHDFLLAQPDFMVNIGKALGPILAPIGKMPKPIPPAGDLTPHIKRLEKAVRIRLGDQPVIHAPVGGEEMPPAEIAANAKTVIDFLHEKLPSGKDNISHIFIKTTMGPAVMVDE